MTSTASVGGRERPRLFLGFPLAADTVDRLVAWQQAELGGGGRVVPPENLHVTLAFLGATPVAELAAIGNALRESCQGVAEPMLTPTRYRETRSVGMVVAADEDERATGLADDLGARLERLEVYTREKRPWLPHITVLRFRDRPRLDPPIPDLGPVRLSEAAVYHSVLRPSGAQYEVLESVPLGG